ncbi:DUF456 domain-containing protein [Sporosalibacterium faouarense]|uniref:DUF456 domain-containing protein n=1 Tax=Sporosalibacterium faouarense TaxID=516123 RepID=UPI00192CB4D1|nr:DUF456 domain-containing protein [Sporosalibacterium faouarense]
MEIILIIVSLVIMLIGFIGVFLPAIPGTGLIFITALVYGIITKFSEITVTIIVILGILTVVSLVLDYIASLITTKKAGASRFGLAGALIGGITGFIIFSLVGFLIGQFLGAIIGELIKRTDTKKSIKIGLATFVGYILGVVANSTIAASMIVIFILKIIF